MENDGNAMVLELLSLCLSFVKGTCVKRKRIGNRCSMKTILQIKHTFRIWVKDTKPEINSQ
jgi:hypothetical protein